MGSQFLWNAYVHLSRHKGTRFAAACSTSISSTTWTRVSRRSGEMAMNGQTMTTSCLEFTTSSCDDFALSHLTNNNHEKYHSTVPSPRLLQTVFKYVDNKHLVQQSWNGAVYPLPWNTSHDLAIPQHGHQLKCIKTDRYLETCFREKIYWRIRVSIPVPLECKSSALPLELIPLYRRWWGRRKYNPLWYIFRFCLGPVL